MTTEPVAGVTVATSGNPAFDVPAWTEAKTASVAGDRTVGQREGVGGAGGGSQRLRGDHPRHPYSGVAAPEAAVAVLAPSRSIRLSGRKVYCVWAEAEPAIRHKAAVAARSDFMFVSDG